MSAESEVCAVIRNWTKAISEGDRAAERLTGSSPTGETT